MQLTSTKRLSKQQETVRNNREFQLFKEVEFQELEIQLKSKWKKWKLLLSTRKTSFSIERLEVKSNHLKHKKIRIDSIMSETAKEEEF
jgi:hypothetical protein